MDLSGLSDDDLQHVANGSMDKVSDEGLTYLSHPFFSKVKTAVDQQLSPEGVQQAIAAYALPGSASIAAKGLSLADAPAALYQGAKEVGSKAMGMAGKIGLSGLAAAGYGATKPVGGSTSALENPDRMTNAAISVPLGLGAGVSSELISEALANASPALENRAGMRAATAMGIDTRTARSMVDKYGPNSVKDLGKTAMDEGVVPWLGTPAKIGERAAAVKDAVGSKLGDLIDAADAAGAGTVKPQEIALRLSEDPEITRLGKVPGMEGVSDKVDNLLNTLYSNGDEMSLRSGQELRQGIDQSINHAKAVDEMRGIQPYLYKIRSAIADQMNDAVNNLPGTENDALRAINRRYSDLSRIQEIADDRTARNLANRAIGLTDTIAGAGGASAGASIGAASGMPGASKVGSVLGGLIGGAGNKIARTYGPAIDANLSMKGADISEALANALSVGGGKGPNASSLIPLLMSNMVDPEASKPDTAVNRRLAAPQGKGK